MFDTIYSLLILLSILIVSLIYIKNNIGPNNKYINGCHMDTTDSIDDILYKMKNTINYYGRYPYIFRYMFYSIVISFVSMIIISSTITSFYTLLQNVFVIWIILLMLHSYFTHHADKFVSYCLSKGIKQIEKKLKIRTPIKINDTGKNTENTENTENSKNGSDYFTFYYTN